MQDWKLSTIITPQLRSHTPLSRARPHIDNFCTSTPPAQRQAPCANLAVQPPTLIVRACVCSVLALPPPCVVPPALPLLTFGVRIVHFVCGP